MKSYTRYRFLLLLVLTLFLLPRCSENSAVIQNVTPAEAQKMIQDDKNKNAIAILDVRTPGEFASGHLAGAVNIDFNADDFETQLNHLDKNMSYLVYCQAGHRSAMAVSIMEKKGFKSLKNLDGGISSWISEKLPVVK